MNLMRIGLNQCTPIGLQNPIQSARGVIGLRLSKTAPADHAAGPITAPDGIVRDEGLKAYRWRSLPAAVGIPVIGNAGVRAAPRSRQDEQPLVALDESLEIAISHVGSK
jgi:hypothetical protein